MITAGPGCGREDCGLYAQRIILHPDVIASVAAVDEENGTVLLWMNFGDTNSYGPGNALITFEGFKVWGGEIRAINAFFGFPAVCHGALLAFERPAALIFFSSPLAGEDSAACVPRMLAKLGEGDSDAAPLQLRG